MVRIAVDVDGVLLKTMDEFIKIYNEVYNSKKTIEDIKNYDFWKDWFLPEEVFWFICDIIRENMMYIKIVDKLSSKYMRKLNKKHDVDIVSCMKKGVENILQVKLKKHLIFKGIQYNNIRILGRNNCNKIGLGYDIYLDDSSKQAEKIRNFPKQKQFLFTQPWNRKFKCYGNVVRVNSWKDFFIKTRNLFVIKK